MLNWRDMDLPTRIAAWRRAKKKTQRQVAAFLGVAVSTVSMWETAQNPPTVTNLDALIAFLAGTPQKFYGPVPKAGS